MKRILIIGEIEREQTKSDRNVYGEMLDNYGLLTWLSNFEDDNDIDLELTERIRLLFKQTPGILNNKC